MRKADELSNPNSCLNKAGPDEMLFVCLGRDAAAPAAIRFWADIRIRLGLNTPGDPKIREALDCAATMEDEKRASEERLR